MILQTMFYEYKNLINELMNAIMELKTEPSNNLPKNDQRRDVKPKVFGPALLLSVAGLFALITACSSSASKPKAPPPPSVSVSTPLEKNISQYDEFTGRFRAIERVEVRARVDGYLDEIRFTDGDFVKKGDVLFVIDQRPYKIALEQARAELTNAKTRLELTQKELKRARGLRSSGAVSQELIDRRNQEHQSALAAVSSARAKIHSAKLNLEFTEVKAPVSGKISENFVSVGNLVSGGLSSATLLTRIVSFDPIYFTFEVSEDRVLKYLKNDSFKDKTSAIQDSQQTIDAKLPDEKKFTHKGRIDFIDNEIDKSTGTLLVRAVFPNKDLLLTPGMFARAKFSATGRHRELLIPDKAIGSDQSQRYVLVVGDSSKVSRKFVKTGPLHNNLRIIEQGLNKTDRVITDGLAKVRPGQKVTPNQHNIALASEGH